MANEFEIVKGFPVGLDVQKSIYKPTSKLVFGVNGKKFGETIDCIKEGSFVGWCYQISFSLVSLYENARFNRGYLLLSGDTREYNHSWIEIFRDGKWYSFDPAFDIICEKEVFDRIFHTQIICSFSSDDVRCKLMNNLLFPDRISNNNSDFKIKTMLINQIYQLSKNKGIIIASHNIHDLTYGNNFQYTLKKENQKITRLRVNYLR